MTLLTAVWLSQLLVFAQTNRQSVVSMLVPGFTVEELPVTLSNQNNLRFAPDGTLTSLGYDGKIWRLRDSNGDGLEDTAEPFWNKPTLSVPLGMAWTSQGLYVSSKGKVSLLKDSDRDGAADIEEVVASGWPATDVGSGGVDATAVTVDHEGNVFFGLLVADYSNAYRLRNRKDLSDGEISWLKEQGRWREPISPNSAEDQFSLYSTNSPRGTIQKWDPRRKQLSTVATGIRVPVALAFNRAGHLFNTDQEGETWMPDGNPADELNHIIPGHNYGFPPRHDRWLPGLVSDAPVAVFGPQHQSAYGLVFNEPRQALKPSHAEVPLPAGAAQGLFGPESWGGDAFVTGESRGKIWRVRLVNTSDGYIATVQTIARLSMLTMDLAISPRGDLYVSCHSGNPDWGTGPQGIGKLFRIRHTNPSAPVPLAAWPTSSTEVRISFDKSVDSSVEASAISAHSGIEFGEYVAAGDRFEVLKPPYAVVQQQDAAPRSHLAIRAARIEENGRILVLQTDPHPLAVRYAVTLADVKPTGQLRGETVDLEYDLTTASQPIPADISNRVRSDWGKPLPWAPKARASGGTDSRSAPKPDGDWETGRALFFGAQLQCAKCHRIRGEGGLAGPDLSNLIHRDVESVLRDIREPSSTIHPDYVTYRIATLDGETFDGFIRSQAEDDLKLFDAEGKETSIKRPNIKTLQPTELSLMPVGLLEGLKVDQVRDLMTFLVWQPPKRSNEEVQKVAATLSKNNSQPDRELRLVLVASKQDHGAGQHDYPNWQTNWTRLLDAPKRRVLAKTAWEWPSPEQFEWASVIAFYFWNHDWSATRYSEMDTYLKRGGGVALIHSAVIADSDPELLAQRMGLSAQPGRTGYRHMPFELQLNDLKHPITRGLPRTINLLDEPYWPLIGAADRVHLLASATVDGASRPLIWTREVGQGRVFASVLGHYTWTLEDPFFRLILLRGIAWAGQEDPSRLEQNAFVGHE